MAQEVKSFCGQLSHLYNRNRNVGKPFALVFALPDGETIARLSEDQECKRWKNEVQWSADGRGRLWDGTTESLVYLTADSGEELTELKTDETYVIGGISRLEVLCISTEYLKRAQAAGIRIACLPKAATRRGLTVTAAFETLVSLVNVRNCEHALPQKTESSKQILTRATAKKGH
ncbi:hypothetical protein DFH06DRAFT_984334 [Mycena polygramma]|nr:hypothetical protein DFH06DRAFT_984334 [Mycena polygramma]